MNLNSNYQNLGIIDIQMYYPRYYVDQTELEAHDKIDKGKYTIGLGQLKMSFTGDNEDINSFSLTGLNKLMTRNNINPKDVGRLEVGTETFLDKSKSIKTYLMDLFKENCDIEGVTTTNACYGGTNALLNTINWMQSKYYDGRYGIVIMADIAVYAKGPARPTGGSGVIAMLLGPNASILIEQTRASYMNNVYDFFKPNPSSEYPIVDGHFSNDCYNKALEENYYTYIDKLKSQSNQEINLNHFDYFCFHCPYAKMVEKAFYQLVSYDIAKNKNSKQYGENNYYNSNNKEINEILDTISNRPRDYKLKVELQQKLKSAFSSIFKNKVEPGLAISKNLGNIYCGSLYSLLLGTILNKDNDLLNKRIFMFSYGSGCASSIFSLKIISNDYHKIRERNFDTIENLNRRIKLSPLEYEKILLNKERLYLSNNYESKFDKNELFDQTFYLEKVDDKWRRYYIRHDANMKPNDKVRRIEFNKLSNKNDSKIDYCHYSKGLRRLSLIKDHLNSTKDLSYDQDNKSFIKKSLDF